MNTNVDFLRGILLDVYNKEVKILDIKRDYDSYCKILDCSVVDFGIRRIGNQKRYTIICDDTGAHKNNKKVSAIDNSRNIQFFGNIFIAGMPDGDGNITSLTESDIDCIAGKIGVTSDEKDVVLTQCNYW